jgi:hypothetical protein
MKKILLSTLVLSIVCLGFSIVSIPASAEEPSPSAAAGDATDVSQFVAYYFHGNFRCATCKKLEAYSQEAISEAFADELAAGTLSWKVLNTDEKANKHFVTDFELVTKAVVLVEYLDGKVVRFENLNDVWELVGDKEEFIKYVQDSTREFLGQG